MSKDVSFNGVRGFESGLDCMVDDMTADDDDREGVVELDNAC